MPNVEMLGNACQNRYGQEGRDIVLDDPPKPWEANRREKNQRVRHRDGFYWFGGFKDERGWTCVAQALNAYGGGIYPRPLMDTEFGTRLRQEDLETIQSWEFYPPSTPTAHIQ